MTEADVDLLPKLAYCLPFLIGVRRQRSGEVLYCCVCGQDWDGGPELHRPGCWIPPIIDRIKALVQEVE